MIPASLSRAISEGARVSIDSRSIQEGEVFFALKGDRFDGNLFVQSALDRACRLAVMDNPFHFDSISDSDRARVLLVKNSLESLQQLALMHRKNFSIPVIGITGSNGKTTTKELLREVLAQGYQVVASEGNLNNHIGVPLSLLRINADTRIAIIEMGANHQGEIALLCQLAQPTHGVITNIGKAHLEGFGGYEGVVRAKTELYDYIRTSGGHLFVNADDPLLMDLSAGIKRSLFFNNKHTLPGIGYQITRLQPFLSLSFFDSGPGFASLSQKNTGEFSVHSQLTGSYNSANIMVAVCAGMHFNIDPLIISRAIENYRPGNNRSQISQTANLRLIMDAYNANPSSVSAALDNLAQFDGDDKMVMLGDMLELGEESAHEHQIVVNRLQAMNLRLAVLCGPHFIKSRVSDKKFMFFADTDAALNWLKTAEPLHGTILIKGSRGMQMEKLAECLLQQNQ